MIDGLVQLGHDLRQARGNAGEARAPRADHRIPASPVSGEDWRVLGAASDLYVGNAAQNVGFEIGSRILLDDNVGFDLNGDADLLDIAGIDPDFLDPAGRHAVVLDHRALSQSAHRPGEIDVVGRVLRRQLGARQPQHRDEGDGDHQQDKGAHRDVMCSGFHRAYLFCATQERTGGPTRAAGAASAAIASPACAARPRGPWK